MADKNSSARLAHSFLQTYGFFPAWGIAFKPDESFLFKNEQSRMFTDWFSNVVSAITGAQALRPRGELLSNLMKAFCLKTNNRGCLLIGFQMSSARSRVRQLAAAITGAQDNSLRVTHWKGDSMKLMDYTGRLNQHHEYVRVLKKLRQTCQYVEYVMIFEEDDDSGLPAELRDSVILETRTKKWWGTKSSHRRRLYRIKWSDEVFAYLKQFETFCKASFVNGEMIVEDTDFGQNDIAFFDDETIPLLFTTTHEGFISIRDDLLKSLSDF